MYFLRRNNKGNKGFTFVEVIIGAALFGMIAVAVYQSYGALFSLVSSTRVKTVAADLANEEMENIRNMPYSDVGIPGGIPTGTVPREKTVEKDGFVFNLTTSIRNIDDSFDGTIGGDPNDLSPADYKMVQFDIDCPTCDDFPTMEIIGRVSPLNLETSSNNGALFIRVFDANGLPIEDVDVHIENNAENPAINIDEQTGNDGVLQIVDAPPGVNVYEITVTKQGYSTDQNYPPGDPNNPNPSKSYATVVVGTVTQTSFVIDKLSDISFSTVTYLCAEVPSVSFNMKGEKLVGTSPDIYKYDEDHTTGSFGDLIVPNVEWDTYNFSILNSAHELAGVNPLMPVEVLPGADQNIQLIVKEKEPRTLLIAVKDSNSGLPLSDANVSITGLVSDSAITGRGSLTQTDWSGGPGQDTIGDNTRFLTSDGSVETSNPAGELVLSSVLGNYATNGNLTSSTFDTGTTSNFFQLNWEPTSQPPQVGTPNVRFRIATNNDNETWEYKGPDGSTGSYYDTTNTNIASAHNGDRYLRYRTYLNTADILHTPNVSDVAFTFTSDCVPPGQVVFSNLPSDTYTVNITRDGYAPYEQEVSITNDWTYLNASLNQE